MELKLDKVPLDIAVKDIQKFVQGDDNSVNVGIMQTRIYYEVAKLLNGVIDVVKDGGRDIEGQKFDIPILWINTVLKDIGKENVTLQELFPSEWLGVVSGLVHHELYVEHTGVNTELERRKIVYGIVGEMTGTANATMCEVKSMWLGYDSEWETNRDEVLKVVSVISGPETAPDTPGSIESITDTGETVGLTLGIPTLVDMCDLRAELGYEATPTELLETYTANRDKYSKYVTDTNESPTEPTPVIPTETATESHTESSPVEDVRSVLDDMLVDAENNYRDAIREHAETARAAAEQIKNAELDTEDIAAKIEHLHATTPTYYGGGGGGGSSGWSTGEIVVGGLAVVAVGAALWYGYNALTSNEYDINLSNFDVPDFDVPDFDVPDFDF